MGWSEDGARLTEAHDAKAGTELGATPIGVNKKKRMTATLMHPWTLLSVHARRLGEGVGASDIASPDIQHRAEETRQNDSYNGSPYKRSIPIIHKNDTLQ